MSTWKRGFTLVELLVVIAIVGILVGLLLPAIQAAREAARGTQCRNHLKQLALAFLTHENSHRYFPSGGWAQAGNSYGWGGVPGRGFGLKQPGGWGYTTLPFLEEQALFDLGRGAESDQYLQAGLQRITTVLPIHYCPSRRGAQLYPNTAVKLKPYDHYGFRRPTVVAKSDYAANLGDPSLTCCPGFSPPNLASGDDPRVDWSYIVKRSHLLHTGVSFSHSRVKLKNIADGTSHTYMLGEKHLNRRAYQTGNSSGDDGTVYASHNSDLYRSTYFSPQRDIVSDDSDDLYEMFGSTHTSNFHMAMCDGSVRGIPYSIDDRTHRALGTRHRHEFVETPD